MCVCMYIYCVSLCMYVCANVFVCVCMCMSICVCVHIGVCVCMYVCVWICLHEFLEDRNPFLIIKVWRYAKVV